MPPVGAQNLDNRFLESVCYGESANPPKKGRVDLSISQLCVSHVELVESVILVFASTVQLSMYGPPCARNFYKFQAANPRKHRERSWEEEKKATWKFRGRSD
jgi:hypothetical protein